jgi:hypothetical protein
MVIVGFWNNPVAFGTVDTFDCPKCFNSSNWQLSYTSTYFTLFFIPIIPTGNYYNLVCPICNHQIELSKKEFKNYKSFSDLQLAKQRNEINNFEYELKLNDIKSLIEADKKIESDKALEESKSWDDLVRIKTDDELIIIYYHERYKYNHSMLVAVKREIDKRKIT